jgi:hypothetical protein
MSSKGALISFVQVSCRGNPSANWPTLGTASTQTTQSSNADRRASLLK